MGKWLSLVLLHSFFVLPMGALYAAAETAHRLAPTLRTVVWGYFDARTPPVVRVRSGDTVEIETLPGGGIEALAEAGLPPEQVQPALREVEREVKDRGEVPHILTGPIWVEGAEPGDVLEVKILSVELVVPYAWNSITPGRGFLPDEFPYAYSRLTPLDLARKVARFSDGIELPVKPFFGVMGVAPPRLGRAHQQWPAVGSWRKHGQQGIDRGNHALSAGPREGGVVLGG